MRTSRISGRISLANGKQAASDYCPLFGVSGDKWGDFVPFLDHLNALLHLAPPIASITFEPYEV
jgi:hypothetical protein